MHRHEMVNSHSKPTSKPLQVIDLLANQWNREGALLGTFQADSKQPEGF